MRHPLLEDTRTDVPIRHAYGACARIARSEARNFYYAFLPLPRARRHALYAVYSFARLADDLADEEGRSLQDRLAALDELEARLIESLHGAPRGAVFTALTDAVIRFEIPHRTLTDLLRGVRQDQSVTRFEDYASLAGYCYLVAGTIGLVCSAVFGARGEEADRYAVAQGHGMQLVNIMRDVKEDALRDRVYLPRDLMARHGVTEEEIMAGVPGPGWSDLMRDLAARARDRLEEGSRLLPLVARDARICPALLRDLYAEILDRIDRSGWDVFGAPPELGLFRKVGLMLSAWWRFRVLP